MDDHDKALIAASLAGMSRRTALKGLGLGLVAGTGIGGLFSRNAVAAGRYAAIARTGAWATGGTAAMKAIASYPDPFTGSDAVCELTCQQILGPCYAPKAPVRQDISEAEPGIPMRMAFQLVQADGCTPLEGAEVEVWHTSMEGAYSAEDVEGGTICTNDNQHAIQGYAFRGRAISDPSGKLLFDACYPGWYGGRALHVHLIVRPKENAGEDHTRNLVSVTQLYFPDELSAEVFSEVPGYRDLGQPSVTNTNDNVLRSVGGDVTPYLFGIRQMQDGAMLASKTIAVSTASSCGSRQMGGPGGRRGGPPGGMRGFGGPFGGRPPAGNQ